jgi:hypothetical protein
MGSRAVTEKEVGFPARDQAGAHQAAIKHRAFRLRARDDHDRTSLRVESQQVRSRVRVPEQLHVRSNEEQLFTQSRQKVNGARLNQITDGREALD